MARVWINNTINFITFIFKFGSLMISIGLPAYAIKVGNFFSSYAPLSWVVAGFIGAIIWTFIYWLIQISYRIKINARYDARLLNHGVKINPLDTVFENQRIFLNEFVMPSHTSVENKTFINCEIIGPANMYLEVGNQGDQIREPMVDTIYLDPNKKFWNGVIFRGCIFRQCSFQRITFIISEGQYPFFKNDRILNWISVIPSGHEQLAMKESEKTKKTKK